MKVLGKLRPNAAVRLEARGAGQEALAPPLTVVVKVIDCKNGHVTLGFEAPPEIVVALAPCSEDQECAAE